MDTGGAEVERAWFAAGCEGAAVLQGGLDAEERRLEDAPQERACPGARRCPAAPACPCGPAGAHSALHPGEEAPGRPTPANLLCRCIQNVTLAAPNQGFVRGGMLQSCLVGLHLQLCRACLSMRLLRSQQGLQDPYGWDAFKEAPARLLQGGDLWTGGTIPGHTQRMQWTACCQRLAQGAPGGNSAPKRAVQSARSLFSPTAMM